MHVRIIAFFFILTFAVTTVSSAEKQAPNIVLILADDLGWADLGCYGHRFHETPHIDRLSEQGIRFTQFYAPSPVCSSSRASLLTGMNPARTGITRHMGTLTRPFERVTEPTIAAELSPKLTTYAQALPKCRICHRPLRQVAPARGSGFGRDTEEVRPTAANAG